MRSLLLPGLLKEIGWPVEVSEDTWSGKAEELRSSGSDMSGIIRRDGAFISLTREPSWGHCIIPVWRSISGSSYLIHRNSISGTSIQCFWCWINYLLPSRRKATFSLSISFLYNIFPSIEVWIWRWTTWRDSIWYRTASEVLQTRFITANICPCPVLLEPKERELPATASRLCNPVLSFKLLSELTFDATLNQLRDHFLTLHF